MVRLRSIRPVLLVVLSCSAMPLGCSASGGQTYDSNPDAGNDAADASIGETGVEDATSDTDAQDAAGQDVTVEAGLDADAEPPDLDAAVGGGELIKRSYVGPEGTRDYLLYVPAGYDGTPRPLLVGLHGCSQSASHFAYITGFNHLADTEGFLVVWPEQNVVANASLCWNWFSLVHQRRDTGEAAIIASIVNEVAGTHAVDSKRVYAAGISAGGAMAVVLGAVFPDVFAAIGSVEGCPFRGTPCVGSPSVLPPSTLAGYVVDAMSANARPVPLFAVQGTLDANVLPPNAELLVQQWVRAADAVDDGAANGSVSTTPAYTTDGSAPGGYDYEKDVYLDAGGDVLVERWLVKGLGHAWPGGAPAIAYSDPKGPSASDESWRFFEEHPMP